MLILIKKLGCLDKKHSYALYECSFCLNEVIKRIDQIKRMKSCGCMHDEFSKKHGGYKTKLYQMYFGMKQRCFYSKAINYADYGGRGITVCPEWANDYIVFRDWALSHGYAEGLQINRIDNNGNYEPNNCNWITAKENTHHRRTTILNDEKVSEIRDLYATGNYTQKHLSKIYVIDQSSISRIINGKRW